MILTNTFDIPGREIESILGIVHGNIVRSRSIGNNFLAGLKSIVGGEISEYTELFITLRHDAMNRLEAEAKGLGADAVINIRFEAAEIMQGIMEIMAYGTAVKLK